MNHVVAVVGPSGGPKSSVAAGLVRELVESGNKPVFVIDADPAMELTRQLGITAGARVSDVLDEIVLTEGTAKELLAEQRLQQELIIEGRGFDLITMGKPGGLDAHCYLRTVFRDILASVVSRYRSSVVDCEPGFEYLHGLSLTDIDRLVVVSEPEPEAARVAVEIAERATHLPMAVRRRVLAWTGEPVTAVSDLIPEGVFHEFITVAGVDRAAEVAGPA